MKPLRLATLVSHPIQYFSPLYREVAARPQVDLTVYYCSRMGLDANYDPGFGQVLRWDVPLLEGYRSRFLHNVSALIKWGSFWSLINPSIVSELIRERYDALWVHGYYGLTNWLAIITAYIIGTPILLRGESNLQGSYQSRSHLGKWLLLRGLMRIISAGMYIGTKNREFYQYLGIHDDCLFFTPYSVDNNYFQKQARGLESRRNEFRRSFGVLDERPLILFAGKLIPQKQPLLLLEAYRRVREQVPCAMLFVGDGELRPEMERYILSNAVPDVHISGFLNQSEIPKAYVASDVFVLFSTIGETWGLAVNEAMNFGLPVLASDFVGCVGDLVRDYENGRVVCASDIDAMKGALEMLVERSAARREYGLRSQEIVSGWGLVETADGIVDAVVTMAESQPVSTEHGL